MRDYGRGTPHRRAGGRARPVLLLALAAILGTGLSIGVTLSGLPAPEELFSRRVVQSTKIYDRTGAVLLYEIHGEERRTVIPLAEVPAAVKNATIAAEDANFYRHAGLDLRGILRALAVDLARGDLRQGGSTITQQLVKNALLGHERSFRRKFREALLALVLEAKLPKEQILELYLNQIPYGSNAYGIEAAAQAFFGTHARDLGPAESALLAALPKAPSYYSPYGPHRDELVSRRDWILDRMVELGYLTAGERNSAKAGRLAFLPASRNIRAPHFVMHVRDELLERYGEEEVSEGGLTVITTLDWRLQETAERLVREGAERNERLIKAGNMALAAINPAEGEILAMVGSRDYFDTERDGNFNVATALRQPGSAFKPFVYAAALQGGLTPETVLFDVPSEFNPGCAPDGSPRPGAAVKPEECYHPQNYDETFRGPVTVRQAIAQSLNVPSVKLLYLAGVEDAIRTAEEMGITSLKDRSRFGLSLVLGGAEVRLLEMVSAFGAFANDGVLNPTAAILKVTDAAGRILAEKVPSPRLVLDPEIARTITDMLSDNEARVPVFQPRSSLYFPDRPVAAKTGTTQDFRDAWTIGYTPAIAVGVWAGNNDNAPMQQQRGSGVLAAAPAWRAFMDFALADLPPEEFPAPAPREATKPILRGIWDGEVVLTLDTVSQKRATDLTPPETRREVAFGQPHDTLHWVDRRDPAGPPPSAPERDPQYSNWEAALQAWLSRTGFRPRPISSAPGAADDVHTPENQPRLTLEARRVADGALQITAGVISARALREVAVLGGGRIIASRNRPTSPVEIVIAPGLFPEPPAELEVRAYDVVGNIGSAVVAVP